MYYKKLKGFIAFSYFFCIRFIFFLIIVLILFVSPLNLFYVFYLQSL